MQDNNAIIEKIYQKSYLIRKTVELLLEEKEDYFLALNRLKQNGKRYSLDKFMSYRRR